MRHLTPIGLLAGLLLAVGCPDDDPGFASDDDVADDDDAADDDSADDAFENTISVDGGYPCEPVVSAYYSALGETSYGLMASTVEDHCDKYRAVHGTSDDAVLAALQADYDDAFGAEDGPASCAAMTAWWEYSRPAYEALYPLGSCSLQAMVPDGMDATAPPGTAMMSYATQEWSAWLDIYLGDCSHVQTFEDWLDIEVGGSIPYPVEHWLCYGGEMTLAEFEGDRWSFAASGLVFDGPSGSDANVDFDLRLEFCP